MVPEAGRDEEAQHAAVLKKVPLDGFMGKADWNGVCLETWTRSGVFWPILVTLSASAERAERRLPGP
jgi:ATP sulfurylase